MGNDSTMRPLRPESEDRFLSAIDRGMHVGVQRALAEHKRAGRSIVIERDGEIVEIPADEIELDPELAEAPLRQAR